MNKAKAALYVVKGVTYLTASATMWVAHKTVDKITGKKREPKKAKSYRDFND